MGRGSWGHVTWSKDHVSEGFQEEVNFKTNGKSC